MENDQQMSEHIQDEWENNKSNTRTHAYTHNIDAQAVQVHTAERSRPSIVSNILF